MRFLRQTALAGGLALGIALVGGCDDGTRVDTFTKEPDLGRPVALTRFLYYLDHTNAGLMVVDPDAENPRAGWVGLSPGALMPVVIPRVWPWGRALAVLEPAQQRLTLVLERESGLPEVRRVALSQPYDRISFSEDARYGLLWFKGDGGARSSVAIATKVAVMDLEPALTGDEPVTLHENVLDLEESPRQVLASGPLTLVDEAMPLPTEDCSVSDSTRELREEGRHVAVVVSTGAMAFLDLEHPELRARILTLEPGEQPVTPRFVQGPGNPMLLFTDARSKPRFSTLIFSPSRAKHRCELNEGDPHLPALDIDYFELSTTWGIRSFEVLLPEGGPPVAVAPMGGYGLVAVAELGGNMTVHEVPLDMDAHQVLTMERASGAPVAVIHDQGEPRFALVVPTWSDQGLEVAIDYTKSTGRTFSRVAPLPSDPTMALVSVYREDLVYLLDIDDAKLVAVNLPGYPGGLLMPPDGDRIFMLLDQGDAVLGLDLARGVESSYLGLDFRGTAMLALGERLVVVHDSRFGRITVVPRLDLSTGSAVLIDGIYLYGLLDQVR